MDKLKVNSHGVNAKIQATILSDEEMRKIGFTDYCEDRWYFRKGICFPNTKQFRYFNVTFNVSIQKDGSDIRIDVLDEDFLQPYDYQMLLNKNPKLEAALIVQEQVEQWMGYLQRAGVLCGHERGEYI